jgi:hypothetical protein
MEKKIDMGRLVVPSIEILTFTVPVNREVDLPEAKGSMPSRRIISDGRKHIAPPHATNGLHAVRKKLERLLSKNLARFLGGYFGPDFRVEEAMQAVPEIETSWHEALDDMIARLPALYAEQEDEAGPQWAEMLRRARLSEDQVRARCRFSVSQVAIARIEDVAGLFGDIADAAFVAVLKDLASDARRIKRDSFEGRTEVLASSVAPVRALVDKLNSFSFIDDRVAPMADAFCSQLSLAPKAGRLSRSETALVLGVLGQLEDPEALLESGALAATVRVSQSDLFRTGEEPTELISALPALPAATRPIEPLGIPATEPVRQAYF